MSAYKNLDFEYLQKFELIVFDLDKNSRRGKVVEVVSIMGSNPRNPSSLVPSVPYLTLESYLTSEFYFFHMQSEKLISL